MDKASLDVSRALLCRNDRTWSGQISQCHGKFLLFFSFSFTSTYDKPNISKNGTIHIDEQQPLRD